MAFIIAHLRTVNRPLQPLRIGESAGNISTTVKLCDSKGVRTLPKDSKDKLKPRDDNTPAIVWSAEGFVRDAERFKSLGDPIRLAVIGFLTTWEAAPRTDGSENDGATVTAIACALTGKSGKEPSTLSHHLKELRHAGLVRVTRHGKNVCYRLETGVVHELCARLGCAVRNNSEMESATPAENESTNDSNDL